MLQLCAFVSGRVRLQDAIRSGVDNFDSGIGVYAGDEVVYRVFAPLLDRVMEAYHRFPAVRR